MGRGLDRRLRALEHTQSTQAGETAVVVIYDSETGQPSAPITPGAAVQVWLPDNRRGDSGHKAAPGSA